MVLAMLSCGHALRLPHCRPQTHSVVMQAPSLEIVEPTPDLGVIEVVELLCEGLKENNAPYEDAGLKRLYNFVTPQGRVSIAPPPPKSGMQGGVDLNYWMEYAASPAIGALIFSAGYKLLGPPKITPGTNFRGELCTQLVEVHNNPLELETKKRAHLELLTAAPDEYLEGVLQAVRTGDDLPVPPEEFLMKERFWFSLEQERRPPHAGCWFLKEMLPLQLSEFQRLNEGGEEFEGADTG